jgi:hypothetical protein
MVRIPRMKKGGINRFCKHAKRVCATAYAGSHQHMDVRKRLPISRVPSSRILLASGLGTGLVRVSPLLCRYVN